MTLDELIAQSTNPLEFSRLCNAVFTDMHGRAYQVIDGTRGDNGNDGYVASEACMLAIYCPIKPEQRTDAEYLGKIRSDLTKAAKLKAESKYRIDRWMFVTPRKLADDVISTMRGEAQQFGIDAVHVESTFLANELYRRKHILEGFPALQLLDVSAQLKELREAIKAEPGGPAPASNEPPHLPPATDVDAERQVRALRDGLPTAEAKKQLRVIAYKTTDPVIEVNAALTLLRWFDPADDDHAQLIAFADRGASLAAQLGMAEIAASCHANKAQLLAMAFNRKLIETHYSLLMDERIGLALISDAEKQRLQVQLREMDQGWRGEAKTALELLKQATTPVWAGATLEILGSTWGQLAHVQRQLGETSDADRNLNECRALLMAAKDLHRSAGNELGASNAVFNLANQVRFHGQEAEALELVHAVIPVAERHGDHLLLQKALWMQDAITTGKVPAYERGERRTWTVEGLSKTAEN